ncbi:glucose-1-phosphate thymidylyltransferase RfbA [Actinoplanes flavus]|uniref:Glucose-1-phosphate thymidylyltransferase n=1 Tax=Actinoplanes flavus TaxID=2820290 RepID=A0ABS3URC2_9ACTN|nr:glucose-1-phosphate thymidylyltransferase RfbA [Actinoplanes flavus]MBO3741329.1 glucose-1-phosphate thymidylyltransferase RfbA [Actinoplanes flavus]
MKGIVLAGGNGKRLHPLTIAFSKQLLPVGNKPMIYYPLAVLMAAGIREILIVLRPGDLPLFREILGDGSPWGVALTYAVQPEPRGIADAILIGAEHIASDDCALVLGDNIFHGSGFGRLLQREVTQVKGCTLFSYQVTDPHRYGVAVTDADGNILEIQEKPENPPSHRAVTGLYLYDNDVVDIAKYIRPSARGELEITDVNNAYIACNRARVVELSRGYAWLDTGTPEALLQAGQYVRTLEERQGVQIACLEEIALRMGYIDAEQCHRLGRSMAGSAYGRYVMNIARELGADTVPDRAG